MKKLLLVVMSVAAISLNAQVYTHYFEGATAGADLEDLEDWFVCSKDGYNLGESPIFSDQDKLFYFDYAGSERGISVEIDSLNGNTDATRRYSSAWNTDGTDTLTIDASKTYTCTDTLYAAFLVKPLGPDYGGMRDIFQFELSPSLGNWSRARVFMDVIGGTDVQFGVGKKNSPTETGDVSEVFTEGIGDIYLLVLAYEQYAGADNDQVKLYVNPDPTKTSAEQTAVLVSPDLANDYGSDDGELPIRININQRGHTAEIGCIRVGRDWSKVLQGEAVTGVSLDESSLTLDIGAKDTLTATVAPADAGNIEVDWSSSDESVVTVNKGVVTAVAAGTATITVTTDEGDFTATCDVTVNAASALNNATMTEVSLYPNPSTGTFTIADQAGANIRVINVTGKVVYEKQNIEELELINADLAKGVYFVTVEAGNAQKITKLVVE